METAGCPVRCHGDSIGTLLSVHVRKAQYNEPDDSIRIKAHITKKLFPYNGPVKTSRNLPMIQTHKLQGMKEINSLDLDQVWNIRRNIPLRQLKTAKTSSSITKYYSRYGRMKDNTFEMKQSSRSKEQQKNREAYNCLNKQDEIDF